MGAQLLAKMLGGNLDEILERALRAFKSHAEASPRRGSSSRAKRGGGAGESVTGHTIRGSKRVAGGFAPGVEIERLEPKP